MLLEKIVDQKEKEKLFEDQLSREVLLNERLRVTVLAIAAFSGIIIFSIILLFFEKEFTIFVKGKYKEFTIYIYSIVGFLFLYEILIRVLLKKAIQKNFSLPTLPRYGNAFLETSIPTALIFLNSMIQNPAYSLSIPPVFLFFIFIGLSALRLDYKLSVFTGTVAAMEYWGFYYFYAKDLFDNTFDPVLISPFVHAEKALILFAFGIIIGLITFTIRQILFRSFQSIEDRNNVINIFGQHVSPSVVEKLLNQKTELPSEIRHVCMMFLDIRNFTSFSEKKTPDEVFDYLNYLFDFMIDIINENGGIINKFLGDGFMAVFGAPISNGNDSKNAVVASVQILERIQKEISLGKIPETKIGIGLHSGDAVTGNIGSSKRKEYTIIGDVVNLASRIEQLNKTYGSQLLISEPVNDALRDIDIPIEPKFIGEVLVKGREVPAKIYRLA